MGSSKLTLLFLTPSEVQEALGFRKVFCCFILSIQYFCWNLRAGARDGKRRRGFYNFQAVSRPEIVWWQWANPVWGKLPQPVSWPWDFGVPFLVCIHCLYLCLAVGWRR